MRKFRIVLFCLLCMLGAHTVSHAQLQEDLALKYLAAPPAETSRHIPIIILLHGYGSDEKDLFALKNFFPKNYLVISVRAPYNLPAGGYQWYEGITVNGKRDGDKKQLEDSRMLINTFIAQVVKKYKADPKSVYLIGFSQGAVMCYEEGLINPSAFKGIGVLSGALFNSLKPLLHVSPQLKQLHIFISHGTDDQRIPYAEGKAANDYLKALGLNIAFHSYDGMGHQINKEVLSDLLAWLK